VNIPVIPARSVFVSDGPAATMTQIGCAEDDRVGVPG
jgi:hypothetical protein